MTCRDEIIMTFRELARRSGRDTVSTAEILDEMKRRGSRYRESTIRTHVVSRLCGDAPDHHAVVYDDLERAGHGLYRLRK